MRIRIEAEGFDHLEVHGAHVPCPLVSPRTELVKDRWWYRKYAPGNAMLEVFENEAREARNGLWADPQTVPPWSGGNRKSVSKQTLFLGVAAFGISLCRSQRDMNRRPK